MADKAPKVPSDATPSVQGKAAIVGGGTTGIGRATARVLAARGARVLIFGRDKGDLEDALAEIRGGGGEAFGLAADQSNLDDVRRVFREADKKLGGVDILVNNAAVFGGSFPQQSLDDIEYTVRTNVVGYLACAREAVERMKKKGEGHIVLVGSMSADQREEEASTYVATKAAIQGFSESLRKAVNPDGIKVTLIEPGKVATDMVSAPEVAKQVQQARGKMLSPEDIAHTIYFCLTQPPRCDIVQVQIRPHGQII